jgi:hypothetical protein
MLTKELEREVRGRQVKYCDRFNSTHAIDGAIRVLLKEETIMGEVPGGRRTGSENHHRGDVFSNNQWMGQEPEWKREKDEGFF